MAEFPVDENNLSFSDDEYQNLFITQSSFKNVSTQEVEDTVGYFDSLGDVSLSDNNSVRDELNKLSPKTEEMCRKVFDFSEDVDNGWSVSTQDANFLVTRNYDGQSFMVGGDTKHDESDGKNDVIIVNDELEKDLKRFNSIVSDEDLDNSK